MKTERKRGKARRAARRIQFNTFEFKGGRKQSEGG